MKKWLVSITLALACVAAAEQTPAKPSAPAGPGSYGGTVSGLDLMDVDFMFIGAHPDDDGGVGATFARYALDGGYRGTVITLTGGEGGGNATGRETGRALGLIREEEERRSLAMLGIDSPHFMGLRDFYFTLSADETEKMWGGQKFVCDVIRIVRLRRPEIVVTMWPGPGTHGQHQMAARAATLAYNYAGDASYCPELTKEGIQPFTPLKLYYYPPDAASTTLSVPSDDISRKARVRYADLRNMAQYNYRTQGWDTFSSLPAKAATPDTFMLIASRVPVPDQETSLLDGMFGPSATPVRIEAHPKTYDIASGQAAGIDVRYTNIGKEPVVVNPVAQADSGWVTKVSGGRKTLAPGESTTATVEVTAPRGLPATRAAVHVGYRTEAGAMPRTVTVYVRPLPDVVATFVPTYDIAAYQQFARETGTDWVIANQPTRLPVVVGQTTPVKVTVTNRGKAATSGSLKLDLPAGISLAQPVTYALQPSESKEVTVQLQVDAKALPTGRQSALLPVKLTAGDYTDSANLYLLPSLTIPRLAKAPVIDGDLSDLSGAAAGQIGPEDLWWRTKPDSPADASANFLLGYDDQYLYVGLHVKDDVVVCNIAPDDVKAQLRSDAIGITVDPSGSSRDTSTTMQAAAFPCTTAGFGARGFRDADANQGLMEDTAPGMQVASKKVDGGYDIEFRLPWGAMPARPKAGDTIGLNLVMYDGDQADARVGANISQSGLAWAAFSWGGKQALPYLWPRVTLGK
ncbi:mycothiol S-conjugate amidase [Deinococcus xinjiangensis]|uniref:Mycothiol S-conjugate amidase n=1 Tax=Deinococcus xinjiangensis TaxID=457454 RepID=A0ABP9VK34_9DEIO